VECSYRVSPDIMLKLEAPNQKELFEQMAAAAEVFGCWQQCGCCKSAAHKPRPVVRQNDKSQKFYELHCTTPGCRARFVFGQSQDMKTLFPQRKFPKSDPQAGQYKPNAGWTVWKKEDADGADEPPPPEEPVAPARGKAAARK
jgi:hypothetical protein